jgi:hypothetical protein
MAELKPVKIHPITEIIGRKLFGFSHFDSNGQYRQMKALAKALIEREEAVRQEEQEAIEREIEEIVSRYQTESIGQPLSSIRSGNIRGLRQAQGIIRKRGEK